MKRVSSLLVASVLVAACSADAPDPASTLPNRPNVLVIVTDDQRADGTLQVMSETRRWFKRSGTTFTRAYATTPLCCPSRASLFSGRYVHNHGVTNNALAPDFDQDQSFQRVLDEAGYQTGIAGKFLNRWDPRVDPAHFDEWAIFLEGSFYNRTFNDNGTRLRVPGYSNDHVRKRALEMLRSFEERDDTPWMLYVGVPAAHAPFTPAPPDVDAEVPGWDGNPATRESDTADKPVRVSEKYRADELRSKQLRALLDADRLVGVLRGALGELGESQDTLAIFTGDNGMLWGEHGLTGKRSPYEQSVNVPLMMTWPGRVAQGEKDASLVANIDIAPTMFDAAGIDADYRVDGRSLMSGSERRALLLEHWSDGESDWPSWASFVTKNLQYIEYYRSSGRTLARELYDLTADRWQLRNLLAEGGARDVSRLSSRLQRFRSCGGEACP